MPLNSGLGSPEEVRQLISCDGEEKDVTGVEGTALVEKIKEFARSKNIGKFDIFDGNNNDLGISEIESGDFTGTLKIVRFDAAA
ncbi:MAG: hypothetical protein NTU73_09995 [Ignavibacteriae bacterium]|nr:hypothetical protein [Ignavibacteriota bacterium]